jgi:hypothetical protein
MYMYLLKGIIFEKCMPNIDNGWIYLETGTLPVPAGTMPVEIDFPALFIFLARFTSL